MRRFAVISDIHGNIWALKATLAAIRGMGDIEMIVNAGDLLSGPLEPSATAELLMALDLPTIAGNHERQLLACASGSGGASDRYAFEHTTDAQRTWLAGLPKTLVVHPDILVCHGTPDSDLEYLLDRVSNSAVGLDNEESIQGKLESARQRLIICGHSHLPRTYKTANGKLIVNPGSVGLQAYDDVYPAAHGVENGSPHARFAVCEQAGESWSISHHAVAYDWDRAALAARKNGFMDWERWLSTGRA